MTPDARLVAKLRIGDCERTGFRSDLVKTTAIRQAGSPSCLASLPDGRIAPMRCPIGLGASALYAPALLHPGERHHAKQHR
jgi:hypothetical protein